MVALHFLISISFFFFFSFYHSFIRHNTKFAYSAGVFVFDIHMNHVDVNCYFIFCVKHAHICYGTKSISHIIQTHKIAFELLRISFVCETTRKIVAFMRAICDYSLLWVQFECMYFCKYFTHKLNRIQYMNVFHLKGLWIGMSQWKA